MGIICISIAHSSSRSVEYIMVYVTILPTKAFQPLCHAPAMIMKDGIAWLSKKSFPAIMPCPWQQDLERNSMLQKQLFTLMVVWWAGNRKYDRCQLVCLCYLCRKRTHVLPPILYVFRWVILCQIPAENGWVRVCYILNNIYIQKICVRKSEAC